MKYELEFLEEFVNAELKKRRKKPAADYSTKRNEVQEEIERIKKCLRVHLFSVQCEKQFELYIQQHQLHIIELCDKVWAYLNKSGATHIPVVEDETPLNQFRNLCSSLEDLLTYIETYFSKFFSQDQRIPASYYQMSAVDILDRYSQIEDIITKNEANAEIHKIVMSPMSKLKESESIQNMTFRELI